MCACIHVGAGACGGQRTQSPLELELQVLVSCAMWVLGEELGSITKAVNILLTAKSSLQSHYKLFKCTPLRMQYVTLLFTFMPLSSECSIHYQPYWMPCLFISLLHFHYSVLCFSFFVEIIVSILGPNSLNFTY